MSLLEALVAIGGPTLEAIGLASASRNKRYQVRSRLRPLILNLEAIMARVPLQFDAEDMQTYRNDIQALESMVKQLSASEKCPRKSELLALIAALRGFEREVGNVTYSSIFDLLTALRQEQRSLE